jgi:hypothetical protein
MATFAHDLLQANAITNLVTGTDASVKNKDPEFKQLVRKHRAELLVGLPARRVWLNLRQLRVRAKLQSKDKPWVEVEKMHLRNTNGVEDAVIDGKLISNVHFKVAFETRCRL